VAKKKGKKQSRARSNPIIGSPLAPLKRFLSKEQDTIHVGGLVDFSSSENVDLGGSPLERYLNKELDTGFEGLSFSKGWAVDVEQNPDMADLDTPELSISEETDSSANELSALWVYEPSDIEELAISEIRTVWARRKELCGSVEAAAEVLAVLEVDMGLVDAYQGWQQYMHREELRELAASLEDTFEGSEDDVSSKKLVMSPRLLTKALVSQRIDLDAITTASDVASMSLLEVEELWSNRQSSITLLSTACSVFARLRAEAGVDPILRDWRQFVEHEEIEKLDDLVDDFDDSIVGEQVKPEKTNKNKIIGIPSSRFELSHIEQIVADKRSTQTRESVIRAGQQKFRKAVLEFYSNKCCVTGCSEVSLIEAAHISPYSGVHSNIVENSLCLRVDIHRLFDKLKLSIEPRTLIIHVASDVTDLYYRLLAGTNLPANDSDLFHDLLSKHFSNFQKVNGLRS